MSVVPLCGELEAEVTLEADGVLSWVCAAEVWVRWLAWRVAGLDWTLDPNEQCAQVFWVIFLIPPSWAALGPFQVEPSLTAHGWVLAVKRFLGVKAWH